MAIKYKTTKKRIQLRRKMKCSNPKCNKEIDKYLDGNEDAEGNKYCADCIAKLQLIVKQTGEYYD